MSTAISAATASDVDLILCIKSQLLCYKLNFIFLILHLFPIEWKGERWRREIIVNAMKRGIKITI